MKLFVTDLRKLLLAAMDMEGRRRFTLQKKAKSMAAQETGFLWSAEHIEKAKPDLWIAYGRTL